MGRTTEKCETGGSFQEGLRSTSSKAGELLEGPLRTVRLEEVFRKVSDQHQVKLVNYWKDH